MRRTSSWIVLIGLVVGLLLVSGVALANQNIVQCQFNVDNTIDNCNGTSGSDFIIGADDADNISAGRGNDDIDAKAGNDKVNGGKGKDEIVAGSGTDEVIGGRGGDIINTFDGEADQVNCGRGTDTLFFDQGLDFAAPGINPNTANCENRIAQ